MPRNKYPEETIKKILDTSLQLFLEKGFEQTTVLDIVDNLGGLTRGAFYHHFKSKDEVLEAILDRDSDERNMYEKIKHVKALNGLERLKLALKLALNANVENEQRIAVSSLVISLLSNPRFLAEHIKATQEDAKQIASLLDEGMADGSIKQGNPKIIAELFLLLVNIWMMPNIYPCDGDEMLAKTNIIKQIFAGLGYHFIDEELSDLFQNVFEKLINEQSGFAALQ